MARSPFATTSTVAASWWPSAASSETAEPESGQEESVAETVAESAPATTAERPAEMEPVAADADLETELDAPPSEARPADEGLAIESSPQDAAPVPDWPSFPSYRSPSAESASSWADSPALPDDTAAPGKLKDLAAAVEEMAGTEAGSEQTAGIDTPSDSAGSVAVEPETPSRFAQSNADDHDAPPVFDTAAQPSPAVGEDTLSRARSLLDELSALLPALAAPATPAGPATPAASADFDGIAAGLAAARDEASSQQSDLEALMAVVETARARPRDIDVMLDLSRHVEAIVSLKAGYDRYGAAIDAALAQLRTQ